MLAEIETSGGGELPDVEGAGLPAVVAEMPWTCGFPRMRFMQMLDQ